MNTADLVMVPFRGEGAGSDQLSWGQRELWGGMVKQRSWFPIGVTRAVRPRTTVYDIAGQLGFLVSRHQSMRTRLRFTSDGRPRQMLVPAGEIPLEIVDADGEDPAAVAAGVERRYRETDFDFIEDWPVRVAVVRQRGRPTHQVLILCHLVTDGFGATALLADLANRDPVTGAASLPVSGLQPLAQARWQGSPAGQRQNQQSLRYWERLLGTIPARRFAESGDQREPRFWQARFDSPAMHLATQRVAARTATDTSTVLLAAFSVALSRTTGIHPAVSRVLVSNRFRPGLAAVVAPVSQSALCIVDVRDAGFDEVVARTRRNTMAAYKYAYYDAFQIHALIDRVAGKRAEEIDLSCYFNDRRSPRGRELAARPPRADELREALPRTRFQWGRRIERSERLFLHIEDVPDTVSISMWADTRYTAPAGIESFLRAMEAALVDAALAPGAAIRGAR